MREKKIINMYFDNCIKIQFVFFYFACIVFFCLELSLQTKIWVISMSYSVWISGIIVPSVILRKQNFELFWWIIVLFWGTLYYFEEHCIIFRNIVLFRTTLHYPIRNLSSWQRWEWLEIVYYGRSCLKMPMKLKI